MSGELWSTKYPVLMKMFLPEMNKRRNGKIYDVVMGSRRIVNENVIRRWPIILSTEPCSVCRPPVITELYWCQETLCSYYLYPIILPIHLNLALPVSEAAVKNTWVKVLYQKVTSYLQGDLLVPGQQHSCRTKQKAPNKCPFHTPKWRRLDPALHQHGCSETRSQAWPK